MTDVEKRNGEMWGILDEKFPVMYEAVYDRIKHLNGRKLIPENTDGNRVVTTLSQTKMYAEEMRNLFDVMVDLRFIWDQMEEDFPRSNSKEKNDAI